MQSSRHPIRSLWNHASIVLLILALASIVWSWQHLRLHRERQALEQAHHVHKNLTTRLAGEEKRLNSLIQLRSELTDARDRSLAEAAPLEHRLTEVETERSWVNPPTAWPSWEKESPYIWLQKSSLAKLHPPVFTELGALRQDLASIVALDREETRALNAVLPAILNDYRHLEIQHAELVDEPLPGIVPDGPIVTLRVHPFPEEATRLREEFATTLRQHLGEQRANLLLQAAENWMTQQFNVDPVDPTTYSAVRHPNGSYNISIKGPHENMSAGGQLEFEHYIPRHLLPAFDELRQPPSADPLADGIR